MINGMNISVVPPYKTFAIRHLKAKSKWSRRYVKVKYHSGWAELLEDGQILEIAGNVFYVNQTTFDALQKANNSVMGGSTTRSMVYNGNFDPHWDSRRYMK